MALKTHPNFKSAVPNITNVNEINNIMLHPLSNQNALKRNQIPPGSITTPDLINSFKIDLEKVDRLYHLYYERGISKYKTDTIYSMVIRLIDDDDDLPPLYVELWAAYNPDDDYLNEDDGKGWRGFIFISADVDLFMKVTPFNHYKLVYDFLWKEDGIRVEKKFFDDKNDVKFQESKTLYNQLQNYCEGKF